MRTTTSIATTFVLFVLAALAGCSGDPPRAKPPSPDKQSLYGDPGLVPSRAGEAARRELALAGQLRSILLPLPGVEDAVVDVALSGDARPTRVTVTIEGSHPDDGQLRALVRGVVGELPDGEVRIVTTAGHGPPPPRQLDLALAVGLLGLGLSLGVTLERSARRR